MLLLGPFELLLLLLLLFPRFMHVLHLSMVFRVTHFFFLPFLVASAVDVDVDVRCCCCVSACFYLIYF